MKVYWLSLRDIYHSRSGGAERTAFEVCRRLAERGHETTILSSLRRQLPTRQTTDGVTILRAPTSLGTHLLAASLASGGAKRRVFVADLAHVLPWIGPAIGASHLTVFFRHLHQRTLSGQVPQPLASLLKGVERLYPAVYRSRPFVTESNTSRADLIQLGVPPELITLIPPGVDTTTFRPVEKTQNPTMIYFGGMRSYKRPLLTLEVLRNLERLGTRADLWVLGEGPIVSVLRTEARRLEVAERVHFFGRVSDKILAATVGRAWVNIHFSTAEGWCLSAMEAAACGVPTVAFDVAGIRDSVSHGQSGLLVPDEDIVQFSVAVKALLERGSGYESACVQHAKRFAWQTTALSWERHLLERACQ